MPAELFGTLVSDLQLAVKFVRTAGVATDRMTLSRLALNISYDPVAGAPLPVDPPPVVPLPAGGLLLLSGLGSLAALRHRKV